MTGRLKRVLAMVLALAMTASVSLPTTTVAVQAAVISMNGDEILDVTDGAVTLQVKDEVYSLAKALTAKDAFHDAGGNIYIQLINNDLKICNYSLQGKGIKPVLLEKNVSEIKTAGTGTDMRLTGYVSADGTEKKVLSVEEARNLLGGGNAFVPTQAPVPTQVPVVTGTPVPTQVPVQTQMPVPTQTPVATQTPVLTQAPVATQTPVPTQVPVATQTPAPSKISLIGTDGIVYNDGKSQYVLSAGKPVDKYLELGNLLWVRFANGQISTWDISKVQATEVIVVEAGKSSSIVVNNGIACYYDETGTLKVLTTTPVASATPAPTGTPAPTATPTTAPTGTPTPVGSTTPAPSTSSAPETSATPAPSSAPGKKKTIYADKEKADGIYRYLYNSKKQRVDCCSVTAGKLWYNGKAVKNWSNVRNAHFNQKGNIITVLKNGVFYSVNHKTLKVKELGKKGKSFKRKRGLATHVITKSGAKKNVARK